MLLVLIVNSKQSFQPPLASNFFLFLLFLFSHRGKKNKKNKNKVKYFLLSASHTSDIENTIYITLNAKPFPSSTVMIHWHPSFCNSAPGPLWWNLLNLSTAILIISSYNHHHLHHSYYNHHHHIIIFTEAATAMTLSLIRIS